MRTLSSLMESVAHRLGYNYDEAWTIADELVDVMVGELEEGRDIKIRGLGSLVWKKRKATARKHPKTGEKVQIPERWVLTFSPAVRLRPRKEPHGRGDGEVRRGGGSGKGQAGRGGKRTRQVPSLRKAARQW